MGEPPCCHVSIRVGNQFGLPLILPLPAPQAPVWECCSKTINHKHAKRAKEQVMKKFTTVLAVISLIAAIAVTRASAQGGPLITLDEFGNGNINGTPLPSSLQVEPFSGVLTLAYQLPFVGIRGDVQLFESGPQPTAQSDTLRFDGNF